MTDAITAFTETALVVRTARAIRANLIAIHERLQRRLRPRESACTAASTA